MYIISNPCVLLNIIIFKDEEERHANKYDKSELARSGAEEIDSEEGLAEM